MDDSFKNKAAKVRMLLFDVDGVLTDGTFVPGEPESKRFHSRDGIGLVMARKAGWKLGLISGRRSPVVEARASELEMHFVRLGVKDKLPCLDEVLAQESLACDEVAYMGDDLPDLPVLVRVGLSATVADAPIEVRSRVDYVTLARGGHGAVREFVERVLLATGQLDELVQSYTR